MYKGWQINAVSAGLRSALTLPMIDYVRRGSTAVSGDNAHLTNFFDKIGVSLCSSVIVSLLLYPFDTAKRCL